MYPKVNIQTRPTKRRRKQSKEKRLRCEQTKMRPISHAFQSRSDPSQASPFCSPSRVVPKDKQLMYKMEQSTLCSGERLIHVVSPVSQDRPRTGQPSRPRATSSSTAPSRRAPEPACRRRRCDPSSPCRRRRPDRCAGRCASPTPSDGRCGSA